MRLPGSRWDYELTFGELVDIAIRQLDAVEPIIILGDPDSDD
jgi:hypothetical protein